MTYLPIPDMRRRRAVSETHLGQVAAEVEATADELAEEHEGENPDDERHQAGPGERLTVDQTDKQGALDDANTDSQGGGAGEAIRRSAERADDETDDDHDEVGDAIRRSAEEA
jgi:hypothetical protein